MPKNCRHTINILGLILFQLQFYMSKLSVRTNAQIPGETFKRDI